MPLDAPYNLIICEVLSQYRNFIETGDMQLSRKDIFTGSKILDSKRFRNLTRHQKRICNILLDIEESFKGADYETV